MSNSKKKAEETVTLVPRIHINEFLASYPDMSEMQRAGFKAFANKEWMRPKEWANEYNKYSKNK